MRLLRRLLLWGTRAGGGGFNYYIDSVAGSDSNDGLTADTAWATIGKLTTEAVLANDIKIGLKRGSSWRERLNLATYTGATVGSYGSSRSPLPLIDCSDVLVNASFTLQSGKSNVYEQTVTHALNDDPTKSRHRIWENGTRMQYVADAATCESTPGSFTAGSVSGTTVLLQIHPAGSTNPTSNGRTYEYAARGRGLRVGAGATIRGVRLRRNGHQNGAIEAQNAATIEDVLCTDGVFHNLYHSYGCTLRRAVAYDMEPGDWRSQDGTGFVQFSESAGVKAASLYDTCISYQPDVDAHAAFSHTDAVATHSTITYRGGAYAGGKYAIGAQNTETIGLQLENVWIENLGGANAPAGCYVDQDKQAYADNCVFWNWSVCMKGTEVFFEDSRIYSTTSTATVAQGATGAVTDVTPTLNACTIHLAGATKYVLGNGQSGTITNCVLDNCTGSPESYAAALADADEHPVAADGNVFSHGAVSFRTTYKGTAITNAATYLSTAQADGYELTSVVGDALLGDPSANDWSFGDGSPVDTGGRAAGSRSTVAKPNWSLFLTAWSEGYTGLDGTGGPLNSVAPVASGTPTEGEELSCTTGTWTGITPVLSYQWTRDGAAIGGATSSTYTLVGADVGADVGCTVTATNVVGAVPQASNELGPVAALPAASYRLLAGADGSIVIVSTDADRTLTAGDGLFLQEAA